MNWSCASFAAIASLVEVRAGLRLKPDSSCGHERLLQRKMHESRFANPEDYLNGLKSQPALFDELVEALTVGETFFFRHLEQFEAIQDKILPAIRERNGENHIVRAWSAGCSSGEEPYSLAILLRLAGLKNRFQITATDISRAALEKAKLGIYRKWSLRDPGASWALPFLRAGGDVYALSETIRDSVRFKWLNLAADSYPDARSGLADLDLILCRNVMIYFGRETIASIAARLFHSLAPGGFLLTAATDPPVERHAPFLKEALGDIIVYRKPGAEQNLSNRLSVEGKRPFPVSFSEAPARPLLAPLPPSPRMDTGKGRRQPAPDLSQAISSPARTHPPEPGYSQVEQDAERALSRNDYQTAVRLTEPWLDDEKAAIVHLRSLANLSRQQADQVSKSLLSRHSLSPGLHYLRATILMEQQQYGEAEEMLRRFAYLDGTSPLAFFSLAVLRERRGDSNGARQGYQQTCAACRTLPPAAPIAFSPGETVASLAEAAHAQLSRLLEKASHCQA